MSVAAEGPSPVESRRLRAYVLGKAIMVVVILVILWALQEKDAVVVYMRF